MYNFWATVFALCYRTVVLSVCLSVCLSDSLSVCEVGVLWPNGYMDQDETWRGGRPRPHCVRWRPSPPPKKKEDTALQFSALCLLHVCLVIVPRPHCVRWAPSSPKRHSRPSPNFRPMSVVAKRLHGSRCHLVWTQVLSRVKWCQMGTQLPTQKGAYVAVKSSRSLSHP